MFDEMSKFTMEVISRCFLGDYGTGRVLDELTRLVPLVADGLLSKPRRFPWPLNRLRGYNFGPALDARQEFNNVIGGVLLERRAALQAQAEVTDCFCSLGCRIESIA